MAEPKMSALPIVSPGSAMEQHDPTRRYLEAMENVSKALERRINEPSTNLWDVAGAFLAPTRTGSFFENLGMASKVLGEQQRRESEREIPIAQMRAALEGQRYETANRAKAFGMLANTMGMESPEQAQKALQSGNGLVGLSNKFSPELYVAMARFDPKIAELVKNAAGMDIDRFKAITEASKLNMDLAKMYQQFGKEAVDYFYSMQGGKPPASQPSAGPTTGGGAAPAGGKVEVPGLSANPVLQIFAGGESGGKNVPNAAGTSSAFGPYQITQGTFEQIKQGIPELKNATWEDFKKDVGGIQTPVAEALLNRNQTLLQNAKLPNTLLNQYSVWFTGDTKLAAADPNAPIDQVLSKEAIEANNLQGKKVGDVMNMLQGNLRKGISYMSDNLSGPAKTSFTQQATEPAPGEAPQFGYTQISPNSYRMQYSGRVITFPEGEAPDRKKDILAKAVETEQQIYKQAVEAEAKPWQEKQVELLKYDDYATKQNLSRTDGIIKIIRNNPKIVGLLQQEETRDVFANFINGLGAAAQEGIKAGNFGQIALPVEKYLSTANLNKEERAALGELTRYMAQEFLANMRANRGVLGVNPTDNDARLFQAAAATPSNLAENIYTWAQSRRAEYESANQMYKGYIQYRKRYGTGDPAGYFTNETSPYHNAVKLYADRIGTIMSNAPGMQ